LLQRSLLGGEEFGVAALHVRILRMLQHERERCDSLIELAGVSEGVG